MTSAIPSFLNAEILFDPEDEIKRKAAAKFVMTFGSPYANENWKFSPHMHQEIKNNIQQMSNGKIFVDIMDQGKAGIGPKLMAKLNRNVVNAGLVSVSNLAPLAPELDILNIPFWSSDNQSYANLVTSPIWNSLILEKIRAKKSIDVLFHYAVGPRTVATTKSFGKIVKTPADMGKDFRFRIPSSKTLKNFYLLADVRPRKIGWGETAKSARKGAFEALDPGIIGLYNGPDNLKNELHSISRIQSVQDGWVAVVSQEWLNQLPINLREIVSEASNLTFKAQLKKGKEVTEQCISKFEALGTTIYTPTTEEKQTWIDQCGHSRPEWTSFKKQILGDASLFDQLVEATKVNNGYLVG
jgi:TRAP-type C4-dicarboxylate transport system substrate-binding protein